jgi:3-oxoadipate enol-lactonase
MPYAVGARGARVHYRVVGDRGENVVLLQGLGLSSRFWFEQPELLANDPERPRRVLVLDNRGAGKSDRPRPPYRMGQMADDVVAAMDAADMRRATIVGISMGGMIAQHVALRHPSRVDGLVLLATTPGLPHGRLPGLRALAMLVSLPLLMPRGGRALLAKILLTREQQPNARELMSEWPAALKEDRMPPLAFLGQLSAVALHSTGFRLRKLAVPVVVVGAEHDVLLPAFNSRKLAKLIPHAELEMIADAAHGIPITDRDVVRRALGRLRKSDDSSLHGTARTTRAKNVAA